MRHFERIYNVVEPVEEYPARGYHPVHPEDIFNQRYQIVAKLKFGQFSTVWLAKDTRPQRYVTLKILKADVSKDNRELAVLLHIVKTKTSPGKRNKVLQLLDHFEQRCPNGLHLCLVFPVMISDGDAMTVREKPRYPESVREISKQILQGVNFIHDLGLVHGDLQSANILFNLSSGMFIGAPELKLIGINFNSSAPRYLVSPQRPRRMLDDAAFSELIIKIGDIGGSMAIWDTQGDLVPVTPVALRGPELLQQHHAVTNDSWNQKIDTWALGCLIFQLTADEPLFPVESFGCTTDEVHKSLRTMMNNLFTNDIRGFATYIRERVPPDFGAENIENLANFLWSILRQHAED